MKIPHGSQVVLQASPLAAIMAVVTMTLATTALAAASPSDASVDTKARAIDARVLKIDTHTDVLLPGSPAANFTPDQASQTALDKLGVIIDVSQLTPEGVLQTIALSKARVIASHSDVRALVDNTRNLSDAELDAIKRNGGVVHITPFNPCLRPLAPEFDAKAAALRQKYGLPPTKKHGPAGAEDGIDALPADRLPLYLNEFRALLPQATLSDYIDHLDYILNLPTPEGTGF